MANDIRKFDNACPASRESSAKRAAGLLEPLPVLELKFESWLMDFSTSLPGEDGYSAILTCVDRLTKLVRLTPTRMEGLGVRGLGRFSSFGLVETLSPKEHCVGS